MRPRPHTLQALVAVVFALSIATVLPAIGGCSPDAVQQESSPVETVERLLELRADRSTEASAYAEVVVDPQVALDLASSAEAEAEATTTPTPAWEPPYEASREAATASVVVRWVPDADHPDWPVATTFTVDLARGVWRVSDAVEVFSATDVPPPAD